MISGTVMQNNDVLLENPIGMTGAISFSFSTPCCLFTFWGILVDLCLLAGNDQQPLVPTPGNIVISVHF